MKWLWLIQSIISIPLMLESPICVQSSQRMSFLSLLLSEGLFYSELAVGLTWNEWINVITDLWTMKCSILPLCEMWDEIDARCYQGHFFHSLIFYFTYYMVHSWRLKLNFSTHIWCFKFRCVNFSLFILFTKC